MSRPRTVNVQHCVLTTLTRQHGPRPVFDLLEVSYEYTVPPEREFPVSVPKFDLFLRVVSRSAGPTRIRIRVRRRCGRGRWDLMNDYSSQNTLPLPVKGPSVLSDSFRLPHVKLTGAGLYAVAVYLRPPRSRWHLSAVEYFRVVR